MWEELGSGRRAQLTSVAHWNRPAKCLLIFVSRVPLRLLAAERPKPQIPDKRAMPRRNAHGKVVIEETLNDTPVQKAGATENSDFKPVRHRVRVPIRAAGPSQASSLALPQSCDKPRHSALSLMGTSTTSLVGRLRDVLQRAKIIGPHTPRRIANCQQASCHAAAILNEPEARPLSGTPAVGSRCAACGLHRGVAGSCVTESLIIGLQLRNGAMLPFLGLRQEGTAMKRPEGRGLSVQRRDGAVSANVFQDGHAVHVRISPFFPGYELAAERFSIS
jgi:hypothetical protein